jgi:hypothetical protein
MRNMLMRTLPNKYISYAFFMDENRQELVLCPSVNLLNVGVHGCALQKRHVTLLICTVSVSEKCNLYTTYL